jgi:hypothetical protein
VERVLPGSGGEVGGKVYEHVSKCKSDKTKGERKIKQTPTIVVISFLTKLTKTNLEK